MTWIGGLIAGVFVLGLLIGNWFSGKRQDTETYDTHADKLDYPSKSDTKASIAALARAQIAAAKDRHANDKQAAAYNERSYRIGFWTAIGVSTYTVFTAIILIFTVVQYGETHRFNKTQKVIFSSQLNAMEGQLTEMQAEQRPWLAIATFELGNDVVISNGTVKIYVNYALQNTGRLPAVAATMHFDVDSIWGNFTGDPTDEIMTKQLSICRKSEYPSGDTVFPSDKVSEIHTISVEKPKYPLMNVRIENGGRAWELQPLAAISITGCVGYKISSAKTAYGHTGVSIIVGKSAGEIGKALPLDFWHDGSVRKTDFMKLRLPISVAD